MGVSISNPLVELIDEDDMASDSATKVPTQQSVKAYVDGEVNAATVPDACSLTKSATQSLATGTFVAITFDGEEFDTATLHDNTTNPSRITLTAGYWMVGGTVEVTGASDVTQVIATIYKNGSPLPGRNRIHDNSAASSGTLAAEVSRLVKADVDGDYVQLMGFQNEAATNLNATINCHAWAVKIGPLV